MNQAETFLKCLTTFLVLLAVQEIDGIPIEKNKHELKTIHEFVDSKRLEREAVDALLAGKFREAFLLEELLENEILSSNLDLLRHGSKAKRDVAAKEDSVARQKRTVGFLMFPQRTRATADDGDGGFSGLSLLTNLLAGSSGNDVAIVRKKRQIAESENDVLQNAEEDVGEEEEDTTTPEGGGDGDGGAGGSNSFSFITQILGSSSGGSNSDDDSGGGSSGAGLIRLFLNLLSSSSAIGSSDGGRGGGSGGILGSLLGASSGSSSSGGGGSQRNGNGSGFLRRCSHW